MQAIQAVVFYKKDFYEMFNHKFIMFLDQQWSFAPNKMKAKKKIPSNCGHSFFLEWIGVAPESSKDFEQMFLLYLFEKKIFRQPKPFTLAKI